MASNARAVPAKGGSKKKSQAKKAPAGKQTPQKRALANGGQRQRQPQRQPQPEMRQSMLSPRLKNDIIGIAIIAVALVLMIAVSMSSDAIVTSWVSMVFHNGFGLGAYLFPVFMACFGACFFFMGRREMVMPRIALGLAIMFVGIISMIGVNAPDAAGNAELLFQPAYIVAFGGYIGNGIASVLLNLVGQVIAWVILIALIAVGIVLIGLSISGFFDGIAGRRERRAAERAMEQERYQAPYSRARAKYEEDPGYAGPGAVTYEMGNGNFVPVGAGKKGGKKAKKAAGRGRGADVTQVIGGGAMATMPLDPEEDELVNGSQRTVSLTGKTRKLSGAEDAVGMTVPLADDDAAAQLEAVEEEPKAKKGKKAKAKADADPAPWEDPAQAAEPALLADSVPIKPLEGAFELPDPRILKKSKAKPNQKSSDSELSAMGAQLQSTLQEFNVDARVVGWVHGPTVTLFKVALAKGVRVNKVTALSDDIGLAFAAQSVRIFSPIAGTSLVGIEIPNDARENVLLGDVLPPAGKKPMLMAIGKDVEGNAITADLAKMPHLLIGGTTGSGKSVAINSFIMSVLMRATPDEVRMILIDPKRVELSLYNDIPHLFVPVVTDPHKAASTLAWAVQEMERRLKVFEDVGARNITQYWRMREAWMAERDAIAAAKAAKVDESELDEEAVRSAEEGQEEFEHMPLMMIVIDELADLMMVAGKEVETSISRIAQLARAAGIHMIVATQRPSTNVITGLIKANITNRIAFNVASGIDSRVILDTTGAEHLVGLGDLLFATPSAGKPQRIQGCYVDESEINDVVKFLKGQGKPDYHEDIFATSVPVLDGGGSGGASAAAGDDDESLLWQAAEIVVSSRLGSTSALQRRLKVGYARAGRIMDMLEDKGIVGPANGSKPRDVYIDDVIELENMKALAQNNML